MHAQMSGTCIKYSGACVQGQDSRNVHERDTEHARETKPVSYTNLTLPTNFRVVKQVGGGYVT